MANGPSGERILAIVHMIARLLVDEEDLWESEEEIVEGLLAEGFAPEEIDAAFSWMVSLSQAQNDELSDFLSVPLQRVFAQEESRALSLEAQGFLMRLRGLGILDDELQEEIIGRALEMGEDGVSLEEMKAVAAFTILARTHDRWRRELACVLEDDWARLYH